MLTIQGVAVYDPHLSPPFFIQVRNEAHQFIFEDKLAWGFDLLWEKCYFDESLWKGPFLHSMSTEF